jgi:murein DD-endopeptidase MepM/ murein hydrolase activator NlpD
VASGLLLLLLIPVLVEARSPIISVLFGADVFANDETTGNSHNTQTMPLPEAGLSPLTGSKEESKSTTGLVFSDGSALLAVTSPLGDESALQDTSEDLSLDDLTIYVVHKGDSLAVVAQMFGVTKSTIITANDLSSEGTIKEGDVLVIPPISGITYTVTKGDTLSGISDKYKISSKEIVEFNQLSSTTLKLGQKIIIPGATAVIAPKKAPVKVNKKESSGVAQMVRGQSNKKVVSDFFIWPIPASGRVTQGMHNGDAIDIGAKTGTPVVASAGGTVVVSKFNGAKAWFGGFGNFIMIDHGNGVKTLYAHLSGVNVAVGQKVSEGEKIGLVGNTGRSTGPHLHFSVIGAQHPHIGNTWKK